MKLFIYEYASGGGFLGRDIPPSFFSEGYGMLRSLIADLKSANYDVATILDHRLRGFGSLLAANKIYVAQSIDEMNRLMKKLINSTDATYIIAPESNQILQNLVEKTGFYGGVSLNCSPATIRKFSNKITVYNVLKKAGFFVPKTIKINFFENREQIKYLVRQLCFPLIFKPVDGVGCRGLSIVSKADEIEPAIKKIMFESSTKSFLAQRRIKGTAISVAVLSDGSNILPLALSKQWVKLTPPSSESTYFGGIMPFSSHLKTKIFETVTAALRAFGVFYGYVGVDLIVSRSELFILDINPRITTSYLGLRKILNFNPAHTLVDAKILGHKIPTKVKLSGSAIFSKIRVSPKKILRKEEEIFKIRDLISPPVSPTQQHKYAYLMLCTHSSTLKDAKKNFRQVENHIKLKYSN
ncbi:MAG: ATP-grasp domain-containing protein [Candidatus Bathyarchaeota archaeon]